MRTTVERNAMALGAGSLQNVPDPMLSMHTGLRLSELRLMRWRQVDLIGGGHFPDGSITVGKSKTRRRGSVMKLVEKRELGSVVLAIHEEVYRKRPRFKVYVGGYHLTNRLTLERAQLVLAAIINGNK